MKTLKNIRNIILLSLLIATTSCSKKLDNTTEPVIEDTTPSIEIIDMFKIMKEWLVLPTMAK